MVQHYRHAGVNSLDQSPDPRVDPPADELGLVKDREELGKDDMRGLEALLHSEEFLLDT